MTWKDTLYSSLIKQNGKFGGTVKEFIARNFPTEYKRLEKKGVGFEPKDLYTFLTNKRSSCKVCGGTVTFLSLREGFRPYCTPSCRQRCPEFKAKHAKSCLENFGFSQPYASPSVRDKYKRTMKERYGVEVPAKNVEILHKMKTTLRKNYGVDNPGLHPGLARKARETQQYRYEGGHSSRDPRVREIYRKNSLDRRGVEHFMQDPILHEKNQIARFKLKTVRVEGKRFLVQGYEHQALQWLCKNGIRIRDVVKCQKTFTYTRPNGKRSVYIPDFMIGNIVVEVKSVYTAGLIRSRSLDKTVKAKAKSVVKNGYPILILVMNPDATLMRFVFKDLSRNTNWRVRHPRNVNLLLPPVEQYRR